ncbi:3-oxoacyl-[acyl-carrier-protein] synthase III [Ereboglobus sp. PH5-5]|uniref:3-oxoacyl-ACP synthase III n=1 Tax=Ereboglobus sp. PH5-5 TaxID=2940529 RepID=UPI0024074074|nr:3-oxoacyl-ACP synthase III [Ereboglobus sp. PH5-5]MDF9833040.1 3-oxoacyl-[acyl-carrier-protein] synthase III [Ereboglobus sp. PH5-5]
MKFENVHIESLAIALPDEVWTSAAIEEQLRPLYERLRLPFGRLELMTGIRERRHWPAHTRASDASAAAGRAVLAKSSLRAEQIEMFTHAAVCRDMLEPATASFAHRKIGLTARAQIFDVSNACLGFLNSMVILAGLIESGQIGAGMIVSGENGRPLIEQTLAHLTTAPLNRNEIKPYFANLTIGSGAVAAILCHRSLLPAGSRAPRLIGGAGRAATQHNDLCQGDTHGAEALAMQTDSEQLLIAGVALARETWADFTAATAWDTAGIDRYICHQVGSVHRRKLYETVGLDLAKDFSTFETLGNMGSASLPVTLALAAENSAVKPGDRVALLGIGSGLNCLMLGVEW